MVGDMKQVSLLLAPLLALAPACAVPGPGETDSSADDDASETEDSASEEDSDASQDETSDEAGTEEGTEEGAVCPSMISVSETENYSFESSLTLTTVPVMPNAEINFDWSGVTQDFREQTVDPTTDINMVTVILWGLSLSELEQQLNDDALNMSDLVAIVSYEPTGETAASMFDFTLLGNPVTPEEILPYMDPEVYPPDSYTYTTNVITGTVPSTGIRMLSGFILDESSENTDVVVDSSSTILDYTADLSSAPTLPIAAGEAEIEFDWSEIETNGLGQPFEATQITRALVAHYSVDTEELESRFLELETLADDLWEAEIPAGTSVMLSELMNADGDAFEGIDGEGTWIFALQCGGCANPAPWYLTVLSTCE